MQSTFNIWRTAFRGEGGGTVSLRPNNGNPYDIVIINYDECQLLFPDLFDHLPTVPGLADIKVTAELINKEG